MRKAALIPIGSVFGRLTVVGHTKIRGRQACECVCECGATHVVASSREKGCNYHTAVSRYWKGWSAEHLFDPPVPHEMCFNGGIVR